MRRLVTVAERMMVVFGTLIGIILLTKEAWFFRYRSVETSGEEYSKERNAPYFYRTKVRFCIYTNEKVCGKIENVESSAPVYARSNEEISIILTHIGRPDVFRDNYGCVVERFFYTKYRNVFFER